MKSTLAFAASTLLLLTAASVSAQEAQGPDEPATTDSDQPEKRSKMNLYVPPPDAPLARKDFVHEGFYLRVNAGPGFQYASANGFDGTDFAVGADVLIGGSPSPGMILGGGALGNVGFGNDTGLQYIVGPFFDAYPNAKEGFHLGLMLGAAGATQNADIFGGGGAIWAGYDIWVAPEWSVGFLVRAGGAYMGGNGIDLGTFTTVAMISMVYN